MNVNNRIAGEALSLNPGTVDAEDRAQQLQNQKVTRRFQADVIESFMNEIRAFDNSLPVQYSDRLWLNLIDRVAVYEDGRLVFRFNNGTEITETL